MSCCTYRWYDGFQSTNTVTTYKIEWASPAGDQGGWFLFTTRWTTGAGSPAQSGTDHYFEQPFYSQLVERLRQVTGRCAEDVPFTITHVTVTPAVLTNS